MEVARKNSVTDRKARGSIRDAIRRGSIWHGQDDARVVVIPRSSRRKRRCCELFFNASEITDRIETELVVAHSKNASLGDRLRITGPPFAENSSGQPLPGGVIAVLTQHG